MGMAVGIALAYIFPKPLPLPLPPAGGLGLVGRRPILNGFETEDWAFA